MTAHAVTFAPVADLVAALQAAGVRSASTDPAALNLPSVWVQVTGVTFDYLDGYTINTRLVCIVPEADPPRNLTALAELLNKVTTVVDPTGPVLSDTAFLPDNPTAPMPALVVPFDLPAT